MLNEKKAVGYFPGMYLIYDYDDEKKEGESEESVQKRKQGSFDAIRKKVQDALEKQLNVNVREEGAISKISGESFSNDTTEDGLDARSSARLAQIKLVMSELLGVAPDNEEVEKKYQIIKNIFKDYSSIPGLSTLIFRAFKELDSSDIEIIGSINQFKQLEGIKANTKFQKTIYDIAGGKQPAVGKGEILSAMIVGGRQGDDAKGGGLSFDVKSPEGETLNNKEITKQAQGATDISKFAIEFNNLLNKNFGNGKAGEWPSFIELCNNLGLTNNIETKTKTPKSGKNKGKTVTIQKAKVPNLGVNKINRVLDEKNKSWSDWTEQQKSYVLEALSWLCHVATTHELMIKSAGSIQSSKNDYVVLQKNYTYSKVIKLEQGKKSLPFYGVSTNRAIYKNGGLENHWSDNFEFKKNGGEPLSEAKLYKCSLIEVLKLK